jgi:toxin ParE1/3/4
MIQPTYTRLALQDLARIHVWSVTNFGSDQADLYLRQIEARLVQAARAPGLFRAASSVRPGLMKLRTGSHVAYVLFAPGSLQVVRILHGRMDPERWV